MNEFSIGAIAAPGGGFIAFFRRVHKADNEVILGKGGQPQIFATKEAAKAAAGEHLCAYMNGSLVRCGEKLQKIAAADALFNLPPTVRQRGKTRLTEVVRRAKA